VCLYVGMEDGWRLDWAKSETILANFRAAGGREWALENDAYVMFNKRVGVFYHNIKYDA
jgi:hypothetical protein